MTTRTYFSGGAFQPAERKRVNRLFRAHVFMPSNPRGRIVRRPCYFCVENALKGGYPRLEHLPPAPAHHVDYARPFVVVWCCDSHHRKVDHGVLRVPQKAVCDYTSLIEAPGVAKLGLRRRGAAPEQKIAVPF